MHNKKTVKTVILGSGGPFSHSSKDKPRAQVTGISDFSVWLKQSLWQPQRFKAESPRMVED